MKILVTVASKHGSTREMGEIIAGVLRDAGHEVTTRPPDAVATLEPFDAVVLGSAVYAGRWMSDARAFAERHHAELRARPVWLFSSGPIGAPLAPTEESADALRLATELPARGHRTFAGRVDLATLSWVERTITRVVKAPDGDYRDRDEIRSWADAIAAEVAKEEVSA